MGDILTIHDTVNGAQGKIIATINGNVTTIAEAKEIEVTVTKKKESTTALGVNGELSKAAGFSIAGTMTLHYGSKTFKDLMFKYMETGIDTYFDLLVEVDDKNSTRAPERILYINCNLDELTLSRLNSEEAFLNEEIPFTAETAKRV